MRVEWHGQSAFTLTAPEARVFVDPFGDMGPAKQRGLRFDYPPIEAGEVDLLLVTHEHRTDFLESEEEFAGLIDRVERLKAPRFDSADLGTAGGPIAVVPAAP
jgi:L-ascorbate metabolism protein UlaG (beta-lactamase superfamily)